MKRICKKCNEPKDILEFHVHNKTKGTRSVYCKECACELQKEWYENNKKRHLKNVSKNCKKRSRSIKKLLARLKKMKGCYFCGYDKCESSLDFHHKNPEEKEIGLSRACGRKYSKERLKKELSKCIVVCKNCHGELHENIIKLK